MIIFKLEEGIQTELRVYFFDKIILLQDYHNKWFPNKFNLNMLLINSNTNKQINYSLDRLFIEDYNKLYNWITDKIQRYNLTLETQEI